MARVLHGMPIETLPDSGDLSPEDQVVAYKADTGKAYRSTVAGLGESANHNISDEFSVVTKYSKGDYCIYDNILYRFTADKEAGEWDWDCVIATQVGTELAREAEEIEEVEASFNKLTKVNITTSYSGAFITENQSYCKNGVVYLAFIVDGDFGTSGASETYTIANIADSQYWPMYSTCASFVNSASGSSQNIFGVYVTYGGAVQIRIYGHIGGGRFYVNTTYLLKETIS